MGDSRGPPFSLLLYIPGFHNEISQMPKVSKRQVASKLNGQKGGYHLNLQKNSNSEESDANDTDGDFFHGSQPRIIDNSSSMFFGSIIRLQMMIDVATSCDCNHPRYKVNPASYKGFNCNIEMICKCGNTKRIWAAPENYDEACLLGCKLSGIKQGQIQDLLTCLNFGYTNESDKTYRVNVFGEKLRKLSQGLDIKLDEMKKEDERTFFNQILSWSNTEVVEVSTDGMYPIRNNSGICVSSVMGSINGVKKIICKLYEKRFFQKTVF